MGIMLFLILFLVFILVIVPTLMKNSRGTANRPRTVEIKGIDGSILNFSEDGVSYFKEGNFRFFRSSELKRFSFEKLDENTYEIKLDNGKEIITVPVRKEELQKLFTRTQSPSGEPIYTPGFPWLGTILGTAAGFLIADLIADSIHEAVAHQAEEFHKEDTDSTSLDNHDEEKNYTIQDDFVDYDNEFDTGDFFDDF
ncbi:hypothetical protein [Desulfurobacterium crinifex]